MSSSGAEPLLPAGRFAPHRREQPGAILGTNFANSACAIACRSMVYRWLRIQVSAVTRLAIAGCTEAEIATITGHSLRDVNEKARLHHAARRRGGGGTHRLYNVDISSKNLRHHWNACSRTSVAGVSDLPSVIHSSAA